MKKAWVLSNTLSTSEDSDQTGRMQSARLIWVFAGRIAILLVLSWGGSLVSDFLNNACNGIMLDQSDLSRSTTKPIQCRRLRLVWSELSLSTWRNFGSLTTHITQAKTLIWLADAQADLSFRWALSHFVGLFGLISDRKLSQAMIVVGELGYQCFHLKSKSMLHRCCLLNRLWYISSSVNSFFERACAQVQWG